MKYSRRYLEKVIENPLPPLAEDERIYLNVPYMARAFAQSANCGFDQKRRLWFAGSANSNLQALVELYGINDATTEKARQMLEARLAKEM